MPETSFFCLAWPGLTTPWLPEDARWDWPWSLLAGIPEPPHSPSPDKGPVSGENTLSVQYDNTKGGPVGTHHARMTANGPSFTQWREIPLGGKIY